MASSQEQSSHKEEPPPSQQQQHIVEEEEERKQAPRHSLDALSTAAAAATAATMDEPKHEPKQENCPSSTFSSNDDSTDRSLLLAKMFNSSDVFKSGDSAAFLTSIMKSSDLFKGNSDLFKSMGVDQTTFMSNVFKSGDLFKSGDTLKSGDIFKSGDLFKSGDIFKSGGMFKSGDTFKSGGGSATVTGMINTKIPDVFTSRDWTPEYEPEHHDVADVRGVFGSDGDAKDVLDPTVSMSAIPEGGTDWGALLDRKLTPAVHVVGGVVPVQVKPVLPGPPKKKPPKRIRERAKCDPEVKEYVIPTHRDVVLGRGGGTNHHIGNKTYLEAKETIQERYMHASKNDKTVISQELVDIITARGGRFLKLDDKLNKWYTVPNIVARRKASQTLREVNTAAKRAAKRTKYQEPGKAKK
jgi:hypothetical protein